MLLNIFLVVFALSIIVNLVGVIFGTGINSKRINVISGLYEISAGMMTGIVCFEMLPDSLQISNIYITVFGAIFGVILTLLLDIFVNIYTQNKKKYISAATLLIIIAMSFHNIIEGVAIGSSLVYSLSLGITLLIANTLHDIPEALVVGIALNKDKTTSIKRVVKCVLLALPTAIGAIVGNILGDISNTYVAISLAVSGGCMLYIVACELIPSSKEISKNRIISLIYIFGILVGLYITKINFT